ncbi:MAG: hypothetical protein R2797_04615 [Gelidibacter sp.]
MKKWLVIILLILIVVIGYNYVFQDHRNISAEMPKFSLTADAIQKDFITDISISEKKYLNKTVAITGTISEGDVTELTLNSHVFCQLMDSLETPIKKESKVKIKGRVIGYDDLLEQVKMDQCTLIK